MYSQVAHALEYGPTGTRRTLSLGADPLPAEVSQGRRIFLTADDPALSSFGLACGGCHPDGRDNGLAWAVDDGVRQTPTLRGRLFAPFTWRGQRATLAESLDETVRRTGGHGLDASQRGALVAFLARGLPSPTLPSPALTEAQRRGRALFMGEADCARCHDPTQNYADGATHPLAFGRFRTPSLRFVDSTPPYFHDGRYGTLGELLFRPEHGMGAASSLAPADRDALEAFLRSL